MGHILEEDSIISFHNFFNFFFLSSYLTIICVKAAKGCKVLLCHEHHEGRERSSSCIGSKGIQSHCLSMNHYFPVAYIGYVDKKNIFGGGLGFRV